MISRSGIGCREVKIKHISFWIIAVTAVLLLAYSRLAAQEDSKVVLGPRNLFLADGASALISGKGEAGVQLTLQGLETAQGDGERKVGHSNLCAGYVMIHQAEIALQHCNWVLKRDPNHWRTYNNRALAYLQLERFEESRADIARGQELSPSSRNLKIAKGMLLDATDPVRPNIEVDERRGAMDEGVEDDSSD